MISLDYLRATTPFLDFVKDALLRASDNLSRTVGKAAGPRKGLLRKPLSSACLRPGSLFCAVPRWCVRFERAEKVAGDCCYLVNGSKECSFVGFRWFVEAAQLSHELQIEEHTSELQSPLNIS